MIGVKKLWRYVEPFSYNTSVSRTDRRTDRQMDRIGISISRVSSRMLTRDKNGRTRRPLTPLKTHSKVTVTSSKLTRTNKITTALVTVSVILMFKCLICLIIIIITDKALNQRTLSRTHEVTGPATLAIRLASRFEKTLRETPKFKTLLMAPPPGR